MINQVSNIIFIFIETVSIKDILYESKPLGAHVIAVLKQFPKIKMSIYNFKKIFYHLWYFLYKQPLQQNEQIATQGHTLKHHYIQLEGQSGGFSCLSTSPLSCPEQINACLFFHFLPPVFHSRINPTQVYILFKKP